VGPGYGVVTLSKLPFLAIGKEKRQEEVEVDGQPLLGIRRMAIATFDCVLRC